MPAEIGQLNSLTNLDSAAISYERAGGDRAAQSEGLELGRNQLTSVPAEIGQLMSLQALGLSDNQLTSVPAEIGQITSLYVLRIDDNR